MIPALVNLLIVALVFALGFWVLREIALPNPFGRIALVVWGVICMIVLVSLLTGGIGFPVVR